MLPAVTMETEASQMLEAALEQMDDIIAGRKSVGVIQEVLLETTPENVSFVAQKKNKNQLIFFNLVDPVLNVKHLQLCPCPCA